MRKMVANRATSVKVLDKIDLIQKLATPIKAIGLFLKIEGNYDEKID